MQAGAGWMETKLELWLQFGFNIIFVVLKPFSLVGHSFRDLTVPLQAQQQKRIETIVKQKYIKIGKRCDFKLKFAFSVNKDILLELS